MKNILKLLAGIVLLGYLAFAFVRMSGGQNEAACKRVDIEVTDSARATFISESDVRDLLEAKRLYPEGIPMNRINSSEIEKALEGHQFILSAQCYKTADNVVHVKVTQQLPVMRILSNDGGNYFIDECGKRISKGSLPADVVVATGDITPQYAKKYLAEVGRVLQKDDFWNSQIEQLNVRKDGTMEFIPRVGNHVVYLGEPVDVEDKLHRLRVFYKKVLGKVGWNKYSEIDVEFGNQIVCTKKE